MSKNLSSLAAQCYLPNDFCLSEALFNIIFN